MTLSCRLSRLRSTARRMSRRTRSPIRVPSTPFAAAPTDSNAPRVHRPRRDTTAKALFRFRACFGVVRGDEGSSSGGNQLPPPLATTAA